MKHCVLNVIPAVAVIPAKAGIQALNLFFNSLFKTWIPAFAGMTRLVGMTCLAGMTICILLAGCFNKPIPNQMGSPDWGVEITWHGHSCFSIKDSLNRTVVIDPFDETVGYGRLHLKADAVLVTHNHFDHNHVRAARARIKDVDLVNSTGTVSIASGLEVSGISAPHDEEGGEINGQTLIFSFIMGGLRLVHLGDLGTADLSPELLGFIGQPDILFIPVGGFTTLDASQAREVIAKVKPRVVIPMHFGDIRFYKLAPLDDFTKLFSDSDVVDLHDYHLRLRRADLKETPIIYTFIPTRNE